MTAGISMRSGRKNTGTSEITRARGKRRR